MLDLPEGSALWVALAQIILIDIILSGDNAVVIALASRALPPRQRRQAVLYGTGAAIGMRVAFAMVATVLLAVPGLKLVGAALLLWIGVTLLLPDENVHGTDRPAAATLLGAIRTILIADAAMSLDNVVAVAAAAKGSVALLGIGLAISVPLMIGTATVLLRVMDRYPIIVTVGAGLLGYVAGEMAAHDPLVGERLHGLLPVPAWALGVAGALLVVGTGKALARRRSRRARPPVDLAREDHSP
jgi:YjbE family integral membrane protein